VRDVDDIGDARAVAAEAPATAFAHTLRRLGHATPHATAEPCSPTEDPPAESREARDARASVAPRPWDLRDLRDLRELRG
jgi:hypothetical protein